jgi:hypothetical protein
MVAVRIILRILLGSLLVLSCIIETRDALFMGGKTMQKVRNTDEIFFSLNISFSNLVRR